MLSAFWRLNWKQKTPVTRGVVKSMQQQLNEDLNTSDEEHSGQAPGDTNITNEQIYLLKIDWQHM
ncbi:hypothetical protein H5410_027969, partial [Solanum commersonii]